MAGLTVQGVALQYVDFASSFLASGAVGFRFAALRGRLGDGEDQRIYRAMARRAAGLGLLGALVALGLLGYDLYASMGKQHTTLGALLGDPLTLIEVGLALSAVVGFALSFANLRTGWWLAALGIVVSPFLGIASGQWQKLVNPVHVLGAGLWLGSLFVLVVAGLALVLRDEAARPRRGAIVAELVNGFSPLALACGGVVVTTGVITAWRHLHTLSALFSTSYGEALIVKLCLVAVVFGLGAWNWRRQRPLLGSEEAGRALRRSSTVELVFAGLVLLATAVLVSLPSPRAPGAPKKPAPSSAPAG